MYDLSFDKNSKGLFILRAEVFCIAAEKNFRISSDMAMGLSENDLKQKTLSYGSRKLVQHDCVILAKWQVYKFTEYDDMSATQWPSSL